MKTALSEEREEFFAQLPSRDIDAAVFAFQL
jgi:hypothetical protein